MESTVITENGRSRDRMPHRSIPHSDCEPPDKLFEPAEEDGKPHAVELTRQARNWFDENLPELTTDEIDITSRFSNGDSVEHVKNQASSLFDSNKRRSKWRSLAKRIINEIKSQLEDFEGLRSFERNRRDQTSRTDLKLVPRDKNVKNVTTIPRAVLLAFFLLLFGFGFLAEFKNAIYLVMNSGLGFENDFLGALAFTFPVVLAPFIGLKYLERCLTAEGQRKFRIYLNVITTPLGFATVLLFSFKIGVMQESVNFMNSSSGAWSPPLWLLLAFEMCLLALMVTMLTNFMRTYLLTFFQLVPVPNAEYVDACQQIQLLDIAIRDTNLLLGEMSSVIHRLDGERETFIAKCLGELHRQKLALAARQAQANVHPEIH